MSSDKEKKISLEKGWGARIKQARENKGFSLIELAKLAGRGTSSGYISELERELKVPGTEAALSLSRALGVSLDWIFTGQEAAGPATYSEGLPREVRDAVQKAYQMVRDFLAVIPNRKTDVQKEGVFVVTVASLLVAGRQDAIPGLMTEMLRSLHEPTPAPGKSALGIPGRPE